MPLSFLDAQQQALGFLVEQTAFIEPQVYETQYPTIQYPNLIPVDNSAPEWTKSVTYYSTDKVGEAQWFHAHAKDIPVADVSRNKFEAGISMAGIGYMYDLEELAQAMQLGINLTTDRADAARRAYEEFVDLRLLEGDDDKGWTGLINDATITTVEASGADTSWTAKDGDAIIADVNDALSGVWTSTLQIEMADTILLPPGTAAYIATKRLDDAVEISVFEWLRRYNVYTMQTGQPLNFATVRGLETAGTESGGRMIAYRKDPQVLKAHIPMPHRFLPAYQDGPVRFVVPGIFRFGGLDVRRPKSIRYVDGIVSDIS
jgi:hypothetical protein